ncbi:hypothetical protein F5Y16DRAFT_394349 [Xylariaceae sp. FL0255]|nr:hypothetical protein F5Y16DRAFT_394349 [Xylariaceae sp. FL0255]
MDVEAENKSPPPLPNGSQYAHVDVDAGQDERPSCVICLDTLTDPCEVTPCGHGHFDYLCLLSWIERVPVCPLCKHHVQDVAHHSGHVYHLKPSSQPSPTRILPPPRHHRRRILRIKPNPSLFRRQYIYRHRLYCLHVGSNSHSRYKEITPASFTSDRHQISRARAWLRRELQVFEFLNNPDTQPLATNPEYLIEFIIAILKTFDIQGSKAAAQDMLEPYLGRQNSILFLHELRNFLRSPFSIEEWDSNVQYPSSRTPPPTRRRETSPHQQTSNP